MTNTAREQQRLLIVDDSKVVRVTARKILRDHFETVEALDGENAWNILGSDEPFSLIISDLSMPNLDGFGLLERIRRSHLPHIRDLPVIIITGANDSDAVKERARQAGATDFIGKPFDSVHLLARTQAHASARSTTRTLRDETYALEGASAFDPLTGIANDIAFMELGYQQLAYAVRHNTGLSVFRIEIDHFGELYKAHGKSVTKSVVQTIANVLTTAIRHEDTAARIGAARFALLLPGLNSNGIHNLADRIRKNTSERVLKYEGMLIHYSISIGVAAMEIRRDTRFDDLLSIADSRLAAAIARGGNQVVHADEKHPLTPGQPDMETAAVDRRGPRYETGMLSAESAILMEELEADLPPGENLPVQPLPADRGIAAARVAYSGVPPGTEQGTPAALNIPDLPLEACISGTAVDSSLPVELTADDTIIITTDSNPYTSLSHGRAMSGVATGTAGTYTGQRLNTGIEKTSRDNPVIPSVDLATGRSGLLKRILKGMLSLFRRSSQTQ